MTRPNPSDRPVVAVQGLGFVGAAMAVAVASARDPDRKPWFDVVAIDLPTPQGRERIAALNSGVFPFPTSDTGLIDAMAAVHRDQRLVASSDPALFAEADVIIVDVNLDLDDSVEPPVVDLEPFRAAIRTVGAHLKPGALVIVETTVPPGTCERIVAPELAAAMTARGLAPDAFLLAHSYERVMPGEGYLASITHFWRVYAGHTAAAAEACGRFLERVIDVEAYPLTRLASTTASETAKVLENSYRAVTIALMEEWARFAEAVGVDLFAVLDAIRRRPTHDNIRQPGFGVGGYCLTKDPAFAAVGARELFGRTDLAFPFCDLAIRVNAQMPLGVLDRLATLLGGTLAGKHVALMGIAYRPGIADTRSSPSQAFVEEARRRGATVTVQDPIVTDWPEMDMSVSATLPAAPTLDAVVFAVAHPAYGDLDLAEWLGRRRPLVLDANAVLTPSQRRVVTAAGCAFFAIGEG